MTGTANGTLTLRSDGGFDYAPDAGFRGVDAFEYTIAGGNTATATIYVRDAGDSLVVHLGFDEAAVEEIRDDASGLAGRVERDGVTAGHAGVLGGAAHFDGLGILQLNERWPIPSFLSLDTDTDFTVAAWVKPETATAEQRVLISNAPDHDGESGFALAVGGPGGRFGAFVGSYDHDTDEQITAGLIASQGTVDDGAWHHVCVTYAFSLGTMTLYVDGTQVGTADISALHGDLDKLETAIGDGPYGGDGGSVGYEGYVDELRIYREALSSAEVQVLAQ